MDRIGSLIADTLARTGLSPGTPHAISGSGSAVTDVRDLPPFHAVEVHGAFSLEVVAGGSPKAVVNADDNIVPLIRTEVDNAILKVSADRQYAAKTPVRIQVSAPILTAFSLSGAGSAALSRLAGSSLRLDISGAGQLTAEGTMEDLEIGLSGAGQVSASALVSRVARVRLSGAGQIEVSASESLTGSLSGVGQIRVHGNPPVLEVARSGIGVITRV